MKYALSEFVKMPSAWIEAGGLKEFRWEPGKGSANVAALMTYIALVHRLEGNLDRLQGIPLEEWSHVRITYDQLHEATRISRTKISAGLKVLEERGLVRRKVDGESTYEIVDYNPHVGWAKTPCRGMYRDGSIVAFRDFQLRKGLELHALKLYLLFISRRDRAKNIVLINYETISFYSGIARAYIRPAISLLLLANLIVVEKVQGWEHDGLANAYRITHVEPYRHPATSGQIVNENDNSLA